MKKVNKLIGTELDFWVLMARNVGYGMGPDDAKASAKLAIHMIGASPSRNWAEGGAIIEGHGICLNRKGRPSRWVASIKGVHKSGDTALVAAMRTYVASVYGDEVSDGTT